MNHSISYTLEWHSEAETRTANSYRAIRGTQWEEQRLRNVSAADMLKLVANLHIKVSQLKARRGGDVKVTIAIDDGDTQTMTRAQELFDLQRQLSEAAAPTLPAPAAVGSAAVGSAAVGSAAVGSAAVAQRDADTVATVRALLSASGPLTTEALAAAYKSQNGVGFKRHSAGQSLNHFLNDHRDVFVNRGGRWAAVPQYDD